MTDSDQRVRPPDNPPPGDEWKPIPGARHYLMSHRGKARSLPRTGRNGRPVEGKEELKPREDGDEYLMFNYTDDNGVRHSNASIARMVLLTHDPDGYFPGAQACHGPGGKHDNRFPENIRWDTEERNREEALAVRLTNNPPKPKPLKVCIRCGAEHERKGRNCLTCMKNIGIKGARQIVGGIPLDKAADDLGYPPAGVFNLAVRYGGLRVWIDEAAVTDSEPTVVTQGHQRPRARWLRSVINRARGSAGNSDGA